ncbi:cupin domain-containing protein [Parafilimonas terrae]|jgi:quercetin dioxygenase-like cupin family protein|uniref:Cupin domain-containing protein n=1 Tax=Parafilimonas terrae TaxID=1465490 RepID=A0A1I5TQV0_9BACT|nr:cupin domain-containing protein [Parafilimonas terrae]SFP85439.1 Cupin domain-containing protein [Parafilimonas terrae]
MILGNIYQQEDFEKIKSKQVYKNERFHTVLLQLKKEEMLKPHHSATDAFLMVAEGEIIFTLKEKVYELKKGDMFSFKAFETHDVKAVTDAIILIIK